MRSTWIRGSTLLTSLGAAPLALAQTQIGATPTAPWTFIGMMAGFGMLFLLGIFALGLFKENRKQRQNLAFIERLVASGHPVPRELMLSGPQELPLAEERRRDIRRGIAFLCWGIGVSVVFYIVSGGIPQAAAWGLLLIVPGLGNFLKAWLTARDIARGPSDGSR